MFELDGVLWDSALHAVADSKDGKEVYYRASDTPQCRLLHQMTELVMQITCPEDEQKNE